MRTKREFIKLEIRLFNDYRFFELSEREQLIYVKLIYISKQTTNKIPKKPTILNQYLRLTLSPIELKSILRRIKRNFPKFKETKWFYYFENYDERYYYGTEKVPNGESYGGTDKDKDKEKDKEKEEDIIAPILYLNQKTKSHFDPKNKGNQNLVKARYNEGRTLEQFKIVIDKKAAQWLNDPKMMIYLRPSTLFNRTNFENYLNEPIKLSKTIAAPKPDCPKCKGTGFIYDEKNIFRGKCSCKED